MRFFEPVDCRGGVGDGELDGEGAESVVDPAAEGGGFRGAGAAGRQPAGPLRQGIAGGGDVAAGEAFAGRVLDAIGDELSMDVESDKVHVVLLGQVFESAAACAPGSPFCAASRTAVA